LSYVGAGHQCIVTDILIGCQPKTVIFLIEFVYISYIVFLLEDLFSKTVYRCLLWLNL